jgi:hypothetical protein
MNLAPPPGYHALVALDRHAHRGLGVAEAKRGAFAASLHSVHLLAAEFFQAARHYPIVFAQDPASGRHLTLAVTGLEAGRNLFVDSAGRWETHAYVPAYVRRWPFFGAPVAGREAGEPDTLIMVDPAGLAADAAPPVFDAGGAPGAEWTRIETLVRDMEGARRQTDAFVETLVGLGLLEPFEAHAFARTGRDLHLRGMRRVSEDRLNALDGREIKRLMKRGELSRVYAHLMSLDNFKFLLDRAAPAAGAAN